MTVLQTFEAPELSSFLQSILYQKSKPLAALPSSCEIKVNQKASGFFFGCVQMVSSGFNGRFMGNSICKYRGCFELRNTWKLVGFPSRPASGRSQIPGTSQKDGTKRSREARKDSIILACLTKFNKISGYYRNIVKS